MRCSSRRDNENLIITIRGSFHSRGLVKFCSVFERLHFSDFSQIIFDMAEVDYLSFKGAGMLTEKMLEAEQAGVHCRVVNLSGQAEGVLQVTNSRDFAGIAEQGDADYLFF